MSDTRTQNYEAMAASYRATGSSYSSGYSSSYTSGRSSSSQRRDAERRAAERDAERRAAERDAERRAAEQSSLRYEAYARAHFGLPDSTTREELESYASTHSSESRLPVRSVTPVAQIEQQVKTELLTAIEDHPMIARAQLGLSSGVSDAAMRHYVEENYENLGIEALQNIKERARTSALNLATDLVRGSGGYTLTAQQILERNRLADRIFESQGELPAEWQEAYEEYNQPGNRIERAINRVVPSLARFIPGASSILPILSHYLTHPSELSETVNNFIDKISFMGEDDLKANSEDIAEELRTVVEHESPVVNDDDYRHARNIERHSQMSTMSDRGTSTMSDRGTNTNTDNPSWLQENQIRLATDNLNFQKEQYNRWLDIFGPVEENLADYFTHLTPDAFVDSAVRNLNRGLAEAQRQTRASFGARGLGNQAPEAFALSQNIANAEMQKAQIRTMAPQQVAQQQMSFLGLGLGQQSQQVAQVGSAFNIASGTYGQQVSQGLQATGLSQQATANQQQYNLGRRGQNLEIWGAAAGVAGSLLGAFL